MSKLFIIATAVAVFYFVKNTPPESVSRLASHNNVIMYSLTTCGYCKAKGKELRQAGIRYSEYFIDEDKSRMTELNDKLEKSGLPPRRYGTPIMDVKGYMMPNNPSMEKIQAQIAKAS